MEWAEFCLPVVLCFACGVYDCCGVILVVDFGVHVDYFDFGWHFVALWVWSFVLSLGCVVSYCFDGLFVDVLFVCPAEVPL